ncbi:hypothetical protein ACFVH6_44545 [Spirillospora sp. NPDC127200]
MRPTPSASRALSCALALSATSLALTVPTTAAHAATTTWKVANPSANGRYTATTTGAVTVRNSAGQTVFTCSSVYQQGAAPNLTSTAAAPTLAKADYTISQSASGQACQRPNGKPGTLLGGPPNGATVFYTPTGYNAATGTTSLTGNRSAAFALVFYADDCRVELSKIAASYTNSTRTLKYTSATAIPFTTANNDGSIGCAGVANNETVSITADFKLDQAISITRVTA